MNTTAPVISCIAAALFAAAAPLAAQSAADDAFLGRSIALGAVLSADEALSWAEYDLVDRPGLDGELERQQVAFRRTVGGASKAFWGVFAARGDESRRLRVPGGVTPGGLRPGASLALETLSLGAETGARFGLGDGTSDGGWFWSPRAAASFTSADLDLRPTAGARLDAGAEALTVFGSAAVGHRWPLALATGNGRVELAAEALLLHTSVLSADDGFPDDDLFTTHGRLRFAGLWPTGGEVFGARLEIGLRARLTLLDDDLGAGGPLGYAADRHADVDLRLMARPDEGRLPVGALGLALRWVDADGLDGWSVGVAVSP